MIAAADFPLLAIPRDDRDEGLPKAAPPPKRAKRKRNKRKRNKRRHLHPHSGLRPFAVPLLEARRLLGNKAISAIYEAIGEGKLVAVKDGNKTLITTASIKPSARRLQSNKNAAA
jgi:hypothetical protein